MGLFCSRLRKSALTNRDYKINDERYECIADVERALQAYGLETCQLIVGIDFTKSNTWTGRYAFGGRCLHEVSDNPNPYESALRTIAKTLANFDSDHLIPCYGFGDKSTEDKEVFSFNEDNKKSEGLDALITRYRNIAKHVDFFGPTSFAPLIRRAMVDVFDGDMRFHVLLILADGQVSTSCFRETADAIVQACYFPLAIIMVGLGDGPWDAMRQFDNNLPKRPWDNFQFVEFHKAFNYPSYTTDEKHQAQFAVDALAEVPRQFKICETRIRETLDTSKNIINQIKRSVRVKQPPDFGIAKKEFTQEGKLEQTPSREYAKAVGIGQSEGTRAMPNSMLPVDDLDDLR